MTEQLQFQAIGREMIEARNGCNEDMETSLGDVLADLMHGADALGISFNDALVRAMDHHKAEVKEAAQQAKEAVPA